MSLNRSEAIHLWNRIGFGPRPGDVRAIRQKGLETFLEEQVRGDLPDPDLDRALENLPWIDATISEIVKEHVRQSHSREPIERALMELRVAKLVRAVTSANQLREVMVDFWFNHFNVYAYSWEPSLPAYEKNAIRPHALGKFRDLLGSVARDPSMMFYLDTYTNVADRIENGKTIRGLNENYGRELMELHTVGVDAGYTQTDITEAARVFTGWTIGGWGTADPSYDFMFDPERHDWSAKNVFGAAIDAVGEEEGDRLLDYLASHPSTARFIATKLVRRFVADDPPASLVDRCAEAFMKSDGQIGALIEAIVLDPAFWSESNRGNKFKTPFEFVASALRATRADLDYPESVMDHLASMGMPLYESKPPTGYAISGRDWMNASSQVYRFDFAFALAAGEIEGVTLPSASGDRRQRAIGRSRSDHDPDVFELLSLLETFEDSILGERLTDETRRQLTELQPSPGVKAPVKALGLLLTSPEFATR